MYLFYVQESLTLVKDGVAGARRGVRYRPVLGSSTDGDEPHSIRLLPPTNGVLTLSLIHI